MIQELLKKLPPEAAHNLAKIGMTMGLCAPGELIQVERQIKNAVEFDFRGTFYVAHVSNPDTIKFLMKVKRNVSFRIVIEMTWHHMFLNHDSYKISGNGVKMNPPLRSKEMQVELLRHLLSGDVDIIGTDHAPHPYDKKYDTPNPYSGVPAILFWPKGIELLRTIGINDMLLGSLIFYNANNVFDLRLKPHEVDCFYQPVLWDRYGLRINTSNTLQKKETHD